jgi:hypothetical protein
MNRIPRMPLNKFPAIKFIPSMALAFLIAAIPLALIAKDPPPQAIAVRHLNGLVHGFLVLRSEQNEILANGEWLQTNRGDRLTSRLIFHFKDGSLHEETNVYSQRRVFRFISYHLVQKGPSFKHPMEVSIDAATSQVAVHSTDDQGKESVITEHINIPPDLANGLATTYLMNLPANSQRTTLSYLAATPKPRMVKLEITPQTEDIFSVGDTTKKVTHYLVKIQIGGLAGVVAPLVGKQPADIHLWILGGDEPAWIKSEGPLFEGGPSWRIELVSPSGPKETPNNSQEKNNSPEKKNPPEPKNPPGKKQ